MSGKVDGNKQGTVSGTCPSGREQGPSLPHCGQCSAGTRQAPGTGSSKIHSCHAHMAPARSLAEALIPFMFLLAVLVFGMLFLSTSRKAPDPDAIKGTPPSSGVKDVPPRIPDSGK